MADPLDCGAVKVHLGGEGYNRKTLNRVKRSIPKQQVRKGPSQRVTVPTIILSWTHNLSWHVLQV